MRAASRPPSLHDVPTSPGDLEVDVEVATEAHSKHEDNPFLAPAPAGSPSLFAVPAVSEDAPPAAALSEVVEEEKLPLAKLESASPATERSPSDAPPATAAVEGGAPAREPVHSLARRALLSEAPTPHTPFEAFDEPAEAPSADSGDRVALIPDAPPPTLAALPTPKIEAEAAAPMPEDAPVPVVPPPSLEALAAEPVPRAPKLVPTASLPKLAPSAPKLTLPPPGAPSEDALALGSKLGPVPAERAPFGAPLPLPGRTEGAADVPPAPKRSIPPPPPSARGVRPPVAAPVNTDSLDDGWDIAPAKVISLAPPPVDAPAGLALIEAGADDGQDLTRPLIAKIGAEPREDLTRPLPAASVSIAESAGEDLTGPLPRSSDLARIDGGTTDVDVTNPLANPVVPYGSDAELTRPIVPTSEEDVRTSSAPPPSLRLPVPKPPPLKASPVVSLPPPPVPVVVAVPPPSSAPMHHPPSIEIAPHAGRRSSVPPPPVPPRSPISSAPPRAQGMTTLPRIPKPARVPKDFDVPRARGSSLAPTTGSIPPSDLPAPIPARKWLVGLAALTFGAGALAVGLRSRPGTLVVTVAGPDGTPARGVVVRVDGAERCSRSPCEVTGLAPGVHLVSAAAAGLPSSADRALALEAGEHAAEHVVLVPAARTEVSGLTVSAVGEGLSVYVDGKNLGAPPVSLRDVEPGQHTVRVAGADGAYEAYEQTVKVDTGEVRSLGPVRLRLLKGRLHLEAGEGAADASITVDGKRVAHLPATLELSPDDSHEVRATRRGFSAFEEEVVFDGNAERSVTVNLESASGAPGARAPRVARNVPLRAAAPVVRSAAVAAPSGGGVATLDLNSIPRANVVVNGRPMGATPLMGVHVNPGTETIVFVHPTLGRKVVSATVPAGGRKAAFVKF